MTRNTKALLFILVFALCHFFMKQLWGENWSEYLLNIDGQTNLLRKPIILTFIYGPMLLCAYWMFKRAGWLEILGLKPRGVLNYGLAAIVCCLPMFAGYWYLSHEINSSFVDFMIGSVYAGFFEEVIFRAALFGVLFRYCGLGFVPAALVSASVFGLAHIYQGNDAISALLAFAITAVGGTWFAWLYCECNYRIWFPMWMHLFMNAAYNFFVMSGGAVGQLDANLYRAMAIIMSLIYVGWLIRKGKPREITTRNLWVNKAYLRCDATTSPKPSSCQSSHLLKM
ncbi:CPBP family intramembrane metalloprotease [Shewanella maritima]|uniref:CPBP family intramembrane metalloprotease n=1 Tax=Shewanella maritima TaxID=2520507 RepID=A0A411PL25_9GAMM|nr:type II CAAX endopeptidase family protein [Shewanella maritima]QBF84237.1 CPBP family intramembrane metalloprotease [Shewanella maritima]